MAGYRRRGRVLAVALVALNVLGLLWIRHEVRAAEITGVRVIGLLPTEDFEEADRLTVVFDRPLAARDETGLPLSDPPFEIEPRPRGHWEWSDADELSFVLAEPLPRGRVYTLHPAAGFAALTGHRILGPETRRLETGRLTLEECVVEYANASELALAFDFDQRVLPSELLRHVRVVDPGSDRELDLEVLSREPARRIVARTQPPLAEYVQVIVPQGLMPYEGTLGTNGITYHRIQVPAGFALTGTGARLEHDADEATLSLRFTRNLAFDQEIPTVEIDPPVEPVLVRPRGNELLIRGSFECERTYSITVGAALLSEEGTTLRGGRTVTIDVPRRSAQVRIPEWRGILSPRGNLGLDVQLANIEGIRVETARVHPNNLVAHVRGESTRATSRPLASRTFPLELRPNVLEHVALDLGEVIDPPRGVYRVDVHATDDRWIDDWTIVSLSDLALTAKRDGDTCLVWVTSLAEASPVEGARVGAWSYNNQLLTGGTTGADGLVRLPVPPSHPDGAPFVLTAEKEGDLNYVQLDRHVWVFDHADTSGRTAPGECDVMLYTERGVYRPGDTMHATGIVRSEQGIIPYGRELAVHVTRPDGREVDTLAVVVPEEGQGVFQVDVPTPADAQTGRWRLSVRRPDGGEELGRTSAHVEAFLPARLEVEAAAGAERFVPGEEPTVAVRARTLLGPPAAELPVSLDVRWRRAPFVSEARPGFTFREADAPEVPARGEAEETLDAAGEALVVLPVPEEAEPGLWRGAVSVTVTEPGSRSVSRHVGLLADTCGRHLGLRLAEGRVAPVDAPFELDWTLRDAGDAPAESRGLELVLHHVERRTTHEVVDGNWVWKTEESLQPVAELAVPPGGRGAAEGAVELRCPHPGPFRVIATDLATGRRTRLDLHATHDAGESWNEAMGAPEVVELVPDREVYEPGATARVLVKSPFAGRLLLTLETNRILWSRVIACEETATSVELPVPASARGGVFLVASVVRPIEADDTSWLPHRAKGIVRLATSHETARRPVEIDAPDRGRPGETVVVNVTTAPPRVPALPAMVHLWAVDEGILSVGGDEVRDPHDHFFAPRRHEVSSRDSFSELLPDQRRPDSMARIGGDEEAAEARRRNPVPARRREAPVVWCAPQTVNADGTARFEVELPDLRGELRWMAVVVDDDAYGAGERSTTVATPVVAESRWPRFLAPGDVLDVPIEITNLSGEHATIELALELDGPVHLLEDSLPSVVELAPGERLRRWRRARATGLGAVTATTRVHGETAGGEALDASARAEFTCRPPTPLHREIELVRLPAGQRLVLDAPEGFRREGLRTRVEIAGDPAVELRPVLRSLVDYPHGCVEQITSRLYALLYAPGILRAETTEERRSPEIEAMIAAGIDRLWSMQTGSGGLAYWSGHKQAYLFGSLYAAGFLVEARTEGVPVRPELIEGLLGYLERTLREGGTATEDPNLRAFLCRALAAFDRSNRGWTTKLTEELDELDMAGRAHLAMAWLEMGRRDLALEVLGDQALLGMTTTRTSGRITSRTRQEAVLLKALLSIDSEHPWIPRLVRRLDEARTQGAWGNTLSNATILTALARYQRARPVPSRFTGELAVGERRETFSSEEPPAVFDLDELADPITIDTAGEGPISILVWTEGLLAERIPPPFDDNLRVRRRWLDADGEEVDPGALSVGDLVLVEVTLSAPGLPAHERVDNVAVVDALPGGFEVENPRLATSVVVGSPTSYRADRTEFLDDRVVVFTSVSRDARTFVYALRAVTAGEFVVPPIQASSMYDPGLASLHGGGALARIAR